MTLARWLLALLGRRRVQVGPRAPGPMASPAADPFEGYIELSRADLRAYLRATRPARAAMDRFSRN